MDNGFVQDSYVDPGLPAYVETDFDLEYLTIPIMVNWHFEESAIGILILVLYRILIGAKETTLALTLKTILIPLILTFIRRRS
jgi:hypothetical protein